MRIFKVAGQDDELRLSVILYLVDHHIPGSGVHNARERDLEAQVLRCAQALLAKGAHAYALDAQPIGCLDPILDACIARNKIAARVVFHVVIVDSSDVLPKITQLLVWGELAYQDLRVLVLGEALDTAFQTLQQILHDKRCAMRPCRELAVLVPCALCLTGADDDLVLHADIGKIAIAQTELGHDVVKHGKRIQGLVSTKAAVARAQALGKDGPRAGLRVALAHVRQDVGDIALKDRVGRDEPDVARIEVLAVLVKQIGDALQEHARLARAGDAVDEHSRHVFVSHDDVLLFLDGGGDVCHLVAALARERLQEQRVLDGDGGVKAAVELVVVYIELAACHKLALNRAPVGLVAGVAASLVVVDLCHGAAPVHDKVTTALVGHAGSAYVDVARRSARFELQGDLSKVGLLLEQMRLVQTLDVHVVGQVVGVDDLVHRLDLNIGLDVDLAGKVPGELFHHRLAVCSGVAQALFERLRALGLYLDELGIGLAQMLLLMCEYFVHQITPIAKTSQESYQRGWARQRKAPTRKAMRIKMPSKTTMVAAPTAAPPLLAYCKDALIEEGRLVVFEDDLAAVLRCHKIHICGDPKVMVCILVADDLAHVPHKLFLLV